MKQGPKNSPETAIPVHAVNAQIKGWIERMGWIWVEGEIAQLNARPNWSLAYVTLRDTEQEQSLPLTCPVQLITNSPTPLREGSRVAVLGTPMYYEARGSFSLRVKEIRPVGEGELLARIEQLRRRLAGEGLFDASRKRSLPYLPQCIGLITGRDSAAERDVRSVAEDRWAAVRFKVKHAAVQGARAVPEVTAALEELDRDPEVDVIIIARGGGSVEDLLPFSMESLQYAVARANTPVVSAIGHEPDRPILDDVADLRAATPTDAAKRVVPDALAERAALDEARTRTAGALRNWVHRERQTLRALRSRPALSDPRSMLEERRQADDLLTTRLRRGIDQLVSRHVAEIGALRARVSALGPAATLARGYAVVQVGALDSPDREIVTEIAQARPGSQLRVRVADGSITAAVLSTTPAD